MFSNTRLHSNAELTLLYCTGRFEDDVQRARLRFYNVANDCFTIRPSSLIKRNPKIRKNKLKDDNFHNVKVGSK